MIVYFDRYYKNSRSASALLLKDRIKTDGHKDIKIFCTEAVYKDTFENDSPDSRVVTRYLLSFRNTLSLYVGFSLFMLNNYRKVERVVSFSSPGWNLLFHGYSFWSKKCVYVVQDIFPENVELIMPIVKNLRVVWRPFFILPYRRIGELETISTDMAHYLKRSYGVEARIKFNTNPYSVDKAEEKNLRTLTVEDQIIVGYSGNLSSSHGLVGPVKLLKVLSGHKEFELNVRGFGKYFDAMRRDEALSNVVLFGGSMDAQEYREYLDRLDVILLFQEDDFERVCLSCKFNTSIELGKPILYIGPESDISRYINSLMLGKHFLISDSIEEIEEGVRDFLANFESYRRRAFINEQYNLNEVLI